MADGCASFVPRSDAGVTEADRFRTGTFFREALQFDMARLYSRQSLFRRRL
jgi:hypothetical protein